MNKRIEELKKIINTDPDDPFLHYALGLECIKIDDLEGAKKSFEIILDSYPDYLPVYYQAANLYVDTGNYSMAKATFKSGIQIAESRSEIRTLKELKNAYQNFLFELDD